MEKKYQELKINGADIAFYPVRHTYHKIVNGKPERKSILSVSGITGIVDKSRILMNWQETITKDFLLNVINSGSQINEGLVLEATSLHRTKKDEAADFGTMVHDWAEKFANSQIDGSERPEIDDSWPQEVKNGINAFVDWWLANDIKFEKTEQMVYSNDYDYCGIFDAIATINGKRVLIDYKTSSGVYPEQKMQACGYAIAYEEEYGLGFDQIMILHFCKKTGEFTPHPLSQEEEEQYKRGFIHCLELKNILR